MCRPGRGRPPNRCLFLGSRLGWVTCRGRTCRGRAALGGSSCLQLLLSLHLSFTLSTLPPFPQRCWLCSWRNNLIYRLSIGMARGAGPGCSDGAAGLVTRRTFKAL